MFAKVGPNDMKALRLSVEMTQDAFAEAVGVDRGTVIAWEKPGAPPPRDLIRVRVDRVVAELRAKKLGDVGRQRKATPSKPADETAPQSSIQRLFADGAAHQREFLWRYTVAVMEAMTEQVRREGPPPDLADVADRAMRAFEESPAATTQSSVAK